MKTCPNCGSVLADNEPYCENCGFDSDYDFDTWNHGRTSSNKPYIHGEHIKDKNYLFSEDIDAIIVILMIVGLIVFTLIIYS